MVNKRPRTKLTPQNEEMVRLVFSGMPATEAYKKTHPNGTGRRSYPSEIMRTPAAKALMNELREKAAKEAVITRNERMAILAKQIGQANEENDRTGLVKLIDTLNKMDGAYEPEKVEVNGKFTISHILDVILDKGCRPTVH